MSTPLFSNRQRITALLSQLDAYLQEKNKADLLAETKLLHEQLSTQEAFAVVCGEFKMGKSTLINALLEQPRLCPVDVDIATSAVSFIRYGENPKVIRHYGEPSGGKTEEIPLDAISKYCVGSPDDVANTFLLDIAIPNPRLKSGLVVMDTPGVGGMDPRHSLLTSYFMPKADMVIYVFDGTPLATPQVQFIRDTIIPRSKHIVFALNRSDLYENTDEKLADAREKLTAAIGALVKEPVIISLSSKLKLRYLETKNPETLAKSNFAALERAIPESLTVRERELQLACLEKLRKIAARLKAPLLVQSEEHQRNSAGLLKDIEERYKERKARAEKLSNPNADYRRRLNEKIEDSIDAANARLKRENAILNQGKLQEYLDDPDLTTDPDTIIRELAKEFEVVALTIDQIIDEGLRDVVEFMNREVDLDLEPLPDYDSFTNQVADDPDVRPQDAKAKGFQKLRAGATGFTMSTGLLYMAGSLVGLTVATPILLVAGVLGTWFALRDHGNSVRKEKVRRAVVPAVSQLNSDLEGYIRSRIRQFRRYVEDMIAASTKAAIDAAKEVEDAFKAARSRSQEESAAMQKQIGGELRVIEVVERGAETLAKGLASNAIAGAAV